MEKKWKLSHLLVAVLALCCILSACASDAGTTAEDPSWLEDPEAAAFVEAIGGVSETYAGAVSQEEYDNAEAAAEAYVLNEILAADSSCSSISATGSGELSETQIKALNLPAQVRQDLVSVERYTVSYVEGDVSLAGGAYVQLSNVKQQVEVYIIRYADYFKYFTPMPETGETVTKSYYDSIFDSEKYQNCTLVYTIEIGMEMDFLGETMDMTAVTTATARFDNGRVYMEMSVESDMDGVESMSYCLYIEYSDSGEIACYVDLGDGWELASLTAYGFSSVEELTPFYDQYLDHSYFVKTDYGCKLDEEHMSEYLSQALDMALDSLMDSMDIQVSGYEEFYVSEGVLSGVRAVADVTMSYEGFDIRESVITDMKCTGYGTTVVERPEGI